MIQQVVVIGAGMVGARFADELVRADPEGQFAVTLLGAEAYHPYNRVLLSDVVAGRADVASLTLPLPEGVHLQRGTQVTAVDREQRLVQFVEIDNDDGDLDKPQGQYSYDYLVFATGAKAFVPPLRGLSSGRPAGVHVLRTVDDGRDLVAASRNAEQAVVVGGGLLGIEAACGLRAQGLDVTIVHHGEHLMDRQLGAVAARTMADSARDLGVTVLLGSRTTEVLTHARRVRSVRLSDDRIIGTDLLLLACGARPETALAVASGLTVHEGIEVDAASASPDDPRVFAIGDCAQPPGGWSGLVAQGWDQARRLARHLALGPAAHPGAESAGPIELVEPTETVEPDRQVVRLKAVGLDVVTLGTPTKDAHTVSLHDPTGRRHVEVSVRDGLLVAASCVGAADVAADLTVAFDRRTPVPLDPASLLLRPLLASEPVGGSPTTMPASATVCRCNGVSKGQVVTAWEGGACSVAEVAACTRATTGCGSCKPIVQGLIDWLDRAEPGRRSSGPQLADAHTADVELVSEAIRS
jgi:assimilatory nitrate reductase electron transfer subunit